MAGGWLAVQEPKTREVCFICFPEMEVLPYSNSRSFGQFGCSVGTAGYGSRPDYSSCSPLNLCTLCPSCSAGVSSPPPVPRSLHACWLRVLAPACVSWRKSPGGLPIPVLWTELWATMTESPRAWGQGQSLQQPGRLCQSPQGQAVHGHAVKRIAVLGC